MLQFNAARAFAALMEISGESMYSNRQPRDMSKWLGFGGSTAHSSIHIAVTTGVWSVVEEQET